MLDENFKGDTLVFGGTTNNHPNKLSVNIDGSGDIHGNAWDTEFLEKSFTNGKYNHILYEHVGYPLTYAGGEKGDEEFPYSNEIAQIHFNKLKPGGTFDFLSWGDIFNDRLTFASWDRKEYKSLQNIKSSMKALGEHGVILQYNEENEKNKKIKVHNPEKITNQAVLYPGLDVTLETLNKSYMIDQSLWGLSQAGFKDIRVQFEENGVLGFTLTHHSLHISAKKPD